MKYARGFTLIELLITVTVMVILMTLAVVSLRSTQVNARDQERKFDAEAIARQLEVAYTRGLGTTTKGVYPTASQMGYEGSNRVIFKDLPLNTLIDPLNTSFSITIASNTQTGLQYSNAATRVEPFPIVPGSGTYRYVYQPIDANGSLCVLSAVCRSFNLYYGAESTSGTAYVIKSKNK